LAKLLSASTEMKEKWLSFVRNQIFYCDAGTILLIFYLHITMLKLVIFDCDGVMFDSKPANIKYYNHLLKHFNRPPMSDEEISYVHMYNVMDSIAHIFRHYPQQRLADIHEYRTRLDYTPFLQFMKMEEDLIDFLTEIQHRYLLAISTNRTDTMESILDIFGLSNYFAKVMTSTNAKKPKPAPDALLEIIDHLGCRIDEAIYIGDSIIDQQHAQSCGMRFIGFKNPELAADFHVNNFLDILQLPPFNNPDQTIS